MLEGETDVCMLSFDLHTRLMGLIAAPLPQANVTQKVFCDRSNCFGRDRACSGRVRHPDGGGGVGGVTLLWGGDTPGLDVGQGPLTVQTNTNDHILYF